MHCVQGCIFILLPFKKTYAKTYWWETMILLNMWIILFREFNFRSTHANTHWWKILFMHCVWICLFPWSWFAEAYKSTHRIETIFKSVWMSYFIKFIFKIQMWTCTPPPDISTKYTNSLGRNNIYAHALGPCSQYALASHGSSFELLFLVLYAKWRVHVADGVSFIHWGFQLPLDPR